MHERRDRGAAAVEFALVTPFLLLLLLGVIAFGHAFHIQTVLDNAARDAVRIFTLTDAEDPAVAARATAQESAEPSIDLAAAGAVVAITPADCAPGDIAQVNITLTDFELLGGIGSLNLTGSGSMRCNG